VFANLKNIFKVEDLRKKVFFTFLMIMVYRLGTALRVPGVTSEEPHRSDPEPDSSHPTSKLLS